jgi:hypothetical protein
LSAVQAANGETPETGWRAPTLDVDPHAIVVPKNNVDAVSATTARDRRGMRIPILLDRVESSGASAW